MSTLSDAQVYAQNLLSKRHGYPLWVPEPYGNSVSYRTKGVRIGDVGYVTEDGAFETCSRPSSTFVHIPFEDIVRIPNFHQHDCTVTSASTKRRAVDLELTTPDIPAVSPGVGTSLHFTWTSSQGAILHLPDGACRVTCPAELFRDVALRGAKSWYKFANVTLRRGVSNGALYLVTGCDKTHSWMVGAFSDKSSDTRASFRLSTSGFCEARASYAYSWDASSPATFRIGPSPPIDSTDTLRRNSSVITQDDSVFSPGDAPEGMTQCVFVRGYLIMLRTNPVALMLGGATKIEVNSISSISPKEIAQAFLDRHSNQTSGAATLRGFVKGGGCRDNACHDNASLFHCEIQTADDETELDYLPAVLEPYHPSTIINELLLHISPQATVSLIHDDEWGSVLRQQDFEIPDETTLLARMLENFWCANRTFSTFLVPRNNQITASEASPVHLKQYWTAAASIKPSTRGEPGQWAGKRGDLTAGTEDLSLREITTSRRADAPDRAPHSGTSPSISRDRTADQQLSEITNAHVRPSRGLPRRVIKPNGRPHTEPNPSTYDKAEKPRFIRRQTSFHA
ncbi:hypothetical protein FPV67DRAFT_1665219 [Lyophyllum atratum]|nr:hypothetical protein FPV67DRAFT_1665219 [Lyophyllum atratum]